MRHRLLASLTLAILLASCNQNPFGAGRDVYAGSNATLTLGQGWRFDAVGRVALKESEGDFFFYRRNQDLYLGIGWDTSTGGPTTQAIAQVDKKVEDFDQMQFAPAYNNGNYKGQILITASSLSNQALFSIYTREGKYALIGITALDAGDSPRIVFRWIWNPWSDGTFNPSYYETR